MNSASNVSSGRAIARLQEIALARQGLQSELIGIGVERLMILSHFLWDYHQIHGTTTECWNILGQKGIITPKEVP